MTNHFYKEGVSSSLEALGLQQPETPTWQKGMLAGAAGLGLGALGYGLMRRFRLSPNARIRGLQQATKGKQYTVGGIPKNLARDAHGPYKVTTPEELAQARAAGHEISSGKQFEYRLGGPSPDPRKASDQVVYHYFPDEVGKGLGAVELGTGTSATEKALQDKLRFHELMPKHTIPTRTLHDVLQEQKVRQAWQIDQRLDAINKAYPGGAVIKGRTGAQGENVFMSGTPKFEQALRNSTDDMLIQPRLPINKEYRVHSLAGHPYSTSQRFLPEIVRNTLSKITGKPVGSSVFLPTNPLRSRRLRKFVEEAEATLPAEHRQGLAHLGYDVAELPGGKFVLVEGNAGPLGSLLNPAISQQLRRQVMGRWSPQAAALGALGLGTAGAVGTAAAV